MSCLYAHRTMTCYTRARVNRYASTGAAVALAVVSLASWRQALAVDVASARAPYTKTYAGPSDVELIAAVTTRERVPVLPATGTRRRATYHRPKRGHGPVAFDSTLPLPIR